MTGARITRAELLDVADCPDLHDEWRRLQAGATGSPFTSWRWVSTWLAMLPPSARALVFRAADGDDVVALGLLVEVEEAGTRRIFGSRMLYWQETGDATLDEITVEYTGLLVRESHAEAAYAALLGMLGASDRSWRALRLSGSTHGHWIARAMPAGLRAFTEHEDASWFVDLAATRAAGTDYLHRLSKSTRAGLRRTERAYTALGEPRLELAPDPQTALAWFGELDELHTRYWRTKGRPGSFASAPFRRFHEDLVVHGHAEGLTQIMRVTAGEQLVGYLYHLVWDGWAHFYSSGLQYGLLKREDRPGYLAQMLAIRHYEAAGLQAYDFMAGASEYKRMMSTHRRPMHWIRISPATWRLALERGIVSLLRNKSPPPALAPAGPAIVALRG